MTNMDAGPKLLAELKRRKVFRVAAVYAATGFVVLQAVDLILPALLLPEWTYRMLVLLVLFGFPVALTLAWAFDITPEGVRRTEPQPGEAAPAEAAEPLPALLGRRTALVSGALVVLGIGLGAGWFLKPAAVAAPESFLPATPAMADKSIAVLPFADLSESGDQKWFADGLAEEILNHLARLGELRVSARNSSFRFEDRAVDVREISRQLGVANVVEGSVRRDGDRLRIGVQLVRAADGFHLWSQSYDRHLQDVFAVQADIAENIARALDVVLDEERRGRMLATGTREPAAFLYYLRGRAEYEAAHQLGLETNDRLWEANAWFDRALEIDPDYALTRFYHHDAYSHALMGDIAVPPRYRLPDGAVDGARLERIMRADLEGALASARGTSLETSLALFVNFSRGDWTRLASAVAAFDLEKAAEGVEIVDGGWLWFPMMVVLGLEPSRELVRWTLERDPLDGGTWAQAADIELHAGNAAEAERLLAAAAEIGLTHRYLDEARMRLLVATGRSEEVLNVEVPRLRGTRLEALARARGLAELGRVEEARTILEDEDHAGFLGETRCWLLARIGDQDAANACAAAIDASPRGWVQFSRMIVENGSIPFDPEAAPRFTALYRASGAPPWPRTEAVTPSPAVIVR
jgi:TolB-like protein